MCTCPPSSQSQTLQLHKSAFGKRLKGPQRIRDVFSHKTSENLSICFCHLEAKRTSPLPELLLKWGAGPLLWLCRPGVRASHPHPGLGGTVQPSQAQGREKGGHAGLGGFLQTEALQPKQILPEPAEKAPASPSPQRSRLHGCVGTRDGMASGPGLESRAMGLRGRSEATQGQEGRRAGQWSPVRLRGLGVGEVREEGATLAGRGWGG